MRGQVARADGIRRGGGHTPLVCGHRNRATHRVSPGSPNGQAAALTRTTNGGATYGQVAKLTADDAAGDFDVSLAIGGTTVVVGPHGDDAGASSGSAYVFRTTDGGATYGRWPN